jgi:hypothetical protein
MTLTEKLKQEARVIEEFSKRNIRVEIGGCGCCGSPWVKVEVDKEVILDQDEVFIDMFEGNYPK